MAVVLTKSRRKLPSPMIDRSSYSIFSVLKQAVGNDLTRFSIPVIWNEPLSFLQRLSEGLQYSSLLDRAASTENSIERFHLIAAFVVSSLSVHLERTSKPFNPLLGETFEFKKENDSAFHVIAEQVSHHPPISAFYARGSNWTLATNVEPKIKFHGTSVVAISEGRWILRIKKQRALSRASSQSSFYSCSGEDDEQNEHIDNVDKYDDDDDEYTWQTPVAVIHNILFGHLWCEFQGEIILQHTQSNKKAVITMKSHSWFSTQTTREAEMFKFNGFIFDGDNKLGAFHGNYGHCYYAIDDINDVESIAKSNCLAGGHNCIHLNSNVSLIPPCNLIITPSSRLIWCRSLSSMTNEEIELRPFYYYFTQFTMGLNEQILSSSITLPRTDCRYRQDIRFLEQGDLDAASAEKSRLEEQQRAEARNRKCQYQPLWFKRNENNEYVYNGEYEKRNFEQCPNLFSQASLL